MDAELQAVVDKNAIQDVLVRYCRGVDRLDAELMKSAYWPDATDDHGVFSGNAMDFVDMCMASHLHWRSTNHCIFNHHIALDTDGIHRVAWRDGDGVHVHRREDSTWTALGPLANSQLDPAV